MSGLRRLCAAVLLATFATTPQPASADQPTFTPAVVRPNDDEHDDGPTDAEIRDAVARALPPLKRGAEGHMAERKCFACHQQTMPLLAMVEAGRRGFAIDAEHVSKQTAFIDAFLATGREKYLQGRGQGGNAMTAGYALLTLELARAEPNDNTRAVVEYLLTFQKDLRHWRSTANRPPSEAGDFAATYVALRAIQYFAARDQRQRADERIAEARQWLETSTAADTEDRVFRLLALKAVGASPDAVQAAADELLQSQRADGGWSQLDAMPSDAYATGTALWALDDAGGVAATAAAYRRGLRYLLAEQKPDGTWHVRSRSKPFQDYFETGFPHDEDQFISSAASGWAAAALCRAIEPIIP